MRIGILGGSFDPIHNGHLHMAVCAHDAFQLDQVWLMPTGHSPNKDETRMTDATHRFHMCELAAYSYSWLSASHFELDSDERSYTYRTVEKLTKQYPMHQFFFIMGGDSLDYFEKWMHPEKIAALCTILVIPRKDYDFEHLRKKIQMLHQLFPCDIYEVPCTEYTVSSTEMREKLFRGECGENDFPAGIFTYIKENGLYRSNKGATGASEIGE